MPGENLLRQVTYRSALYHCGRREWTWREEGQQCCYPTAWHGYGSLVSSSFMELLALSPLLRSLPMRAVHWASRPPPCRTQRGSGLPEREGKNLIQIPLQVWRLCSGKAHPPKNSQVWVRRAHTGSAGPTASKCHPGTQQPPWKRHLSLLLSTWTPEQQEPRREQGSGPEGLSVLPPPHAPNKANLPFSTSRSQSHTSGQQQE